MRPTDVNSSSHTLDLFLIQLAGRYSNSRKYEIGEVIFEEGERGNTMLLVLVGSLKIVKKNPTDGSDVLIASRGAGEFLGEMALVEEFPRSASVIAETSCEVLEFSRESFEKIIREQPELATRVLQSLSNKLRESDSQRISELEERNRLLNASNQELVRLNSFLDCVIDRSPSPVLLTTRTGQIFRINASASKIFELEGDASATVVDDLFADFKLSDFIRLRKDSWHGEVVGKRSDETFPAYLSVASLTGHNDSVLHLMICQDISELQAFNKTVSEFEKYETLQQTAVEVAHDLKNMFGVLLGNVDLMISRLTDEQRLQSDRAIGAIRNSAAEIQSFAENLMSYSEDKSDFSAVDLRTMVKAIARFCRMQGKFQHISLTLDIADNFPKRVLVKEGQIQSVIMNLLMNAAEALGENSESSYRAIQVGLKRGSGESTIAISVSDNGSGIPPEVQERMFKEKITTKDQGHGIGLMSISRIVNAHGGAIAVDSTVDNGSTFTITLPITREN